MIAKSPATSIQIDEIQGLRGIAVLLVVLYHGGIDWLPGGFVGVDIFFVISGYLITGILLRELTRSGSLDLVNFYGRRARRLVPAALVTLMATMGVAWMSYPPIDFKEFTSTAIATALYVSNFWFAHISTDYLAGDASPDVLLHTWSLAVEEQFYLFWPALMLVSFRWLRSVERLAIVLGAVSVVSFAGCVLLTAHDQPWAFFGSPTRAWEFGIGGLIAVARHSEHKLPFGSSPITSIVGLMLLGICAVWFGENLLFPGWLAVIPAVGSGLAIAAVVLGREPTRSRLLVWKPLRFVGDISYSLYLWHWPIIVFLEMHSSWSGASLFSIYIAASLGFGSLSYYLVENPVRNQRFLSVHRWVSLTAGIVTVVIAVGIALQVRLLTVEELGNPRQKLYLEAGSDIPRIYADGCHASVLDTEVRICKYGVPDANRTIVLFGDSHAAQWFPALDVISKSGGYELIPMTKSACPSYVHEPFDKNRHRKNAECTEWREDALKIIAEIKPELVVVANSRRYRQLFEARHGGAGDAYWLRSINNLAQRIENGYTTILILRDTPLVGYNGPSCLSRAAWKNQDPSTQCTFSAMPLEADTIFAIENTAADANTHVFVDSLNNYICDENEHCSLQAGNMVLYHDGHHITARFSESLAPQLLDSILRISPFFPGNNANALFD